MLLNSEDSSQSQTMLPISPVIKKESMETSFSPSSPHHDHHHSLCSPTMSSTTATHTNLTTEMNYTNGGCGFSTNTTKTELMCGYSPAETTGPMPTDHHNSNGGLVNVGRRKSGYESSSSPDSPDRHFCSSTTQSNGDLSHSIPEV